MINIWRPNAAWTHIRVGNRSLVAWNRRMLALSFRPHGHSLDLIGKRPR